jgi:flagellar FliL protein
MAIVRQPQYPGTGVAARLPRWAVLCLVLATLLLPACSDEQATEDTAADEAPVEIDIGYYELKPSIVSNLTGGPKYIRCDVQLMTEQAEDIYLIELHAPALRHTLLMLIAGSDGNVLKTSSGKEGFRKAALRGIQRQLQELAGKPIVKDLYFTAYYVK